MSANTYRGVIPWKEKEGDRMPLKEKRGLLIANAHAGKQGAKVLLYPIVDGLAPEYTLTVHMTESPEDGGITAAMEAKNYDAVFVSGGDGTVSTVVGGLVKAGGKVPVGYFPSGTANDLAATLGYVRDAEENCKIILDGTPTPHDVGLLNDEYTFLYTASFGAFTKVAYETPQDLKNVLGQTAYILSGAAELFNLEEETVTVKWDDGELVDAEVLFLGVMNTHSMGGILKIPADRTDLSDGLFDIIIVKKPKSLAETNNLLFDLLKNNLYDSTNENVLFVHSSHIGVKTARPVAWTVDGEPTKALDCVDIRVLPGAVEFIR